MVTLLGVIMEDFIKGVMHEKKKGRLTSKQQESSILGKCYNLQKGAQVLREHNTFGKMNYSGTGAQFT